MLKTIWNGLFKGSQLKNEFQAALASGEANKAMDAARQKSSHTIDHWILEMDKAGTPASEGCVQDLYARMGQEGLIPA